MGCDIGRHESGTHLAAMRIRTVEPVYIVPSRLEIRGLDCDKTAKAVRVQRGKLQSNASAHRATDEERSFKAERIAESQNRFDVSLGGQQIFSGREPFRRKRLAVPGHVEGNEAPMRGKCLVVQHETPLPRVCSGRVEQQNRVTRPGLLKIEALVRAFDIEADISSQDGFDGARHAPASIRPSAMNSLKKRRFFTNARMSPSILP